MTLPVIIDQPDLSTVAVSGTVDAVTVVDKVSQSNAFVFNNATSTWEEQRTPTTLVFTSIATSGYNTIWTPAAGKKFCLMGAEWHLRVTSTCATSSEFILDDNGTTVMEMCSMGTTTTGNSGSVTFPGNGYKSVAVNNPLRVRLTAALTAGGICVTVWGTEE